MAALEEPWQTGGRIIAHPIRDRTDAAHCRRGRDRNTAHLCRLSFLRVPGGGGLKRIVWWAGPGFPFNRPLRVEGLERMVGFVLLALLLSSLVAGVRRERNQLQDSEERYRILAETASDPIIVIDENGEILYVNPVAEKVFGTKAKGLLGQNLNCLLPGEGYREQLSEMKHRLDSRKKPVAVQLPGLHECGDHLLIEMTMGPASHRGRNLFTAILRDITGQRGI
jgi:PAS domain S-box-containing protein